MYHFSNFHTSFRSLYCLLALFLISLNMQAQTDKGDRILGWQVDKAQDDDYDLAYGFATEACMESIHLFFPWNFFETDENSFTPEGIFSLDIINIYHPVNNVKAELSIPPVNTVAKEMPADLMLLPYDSPLVIDRYKALLDTIFDHIPDLELTALNIGNECDLFFGTNEDQYTSYKAFLDEVIPYAQSLYFDIHGEELKVGTVCTFDGLTSPATSDLCALLNENLDVISTTYYPLNGDFTMESPSVVTDDFEELVSLYSDINQPIYFTECGYSSSPGCNSSEAQQAAFYENVFAAWDEYYDHIKYITIFKTTDWSQMEVDTFLEYYGIDTFEFNEYLRTLGVRTWENAGSNKLAYEQIKCELEARNWCDVSCSIQSTPSSVLAEDWTIFPNPAHNQLTIQSHFSSYAIRTASGKLITRGSLTGKVLDLSSLDAGVYFIEVFNSTTSAQKRFIKL